jgi:hypothetical protein
MAGVDSLTEADDRESAARRSRSGGGGGGGGGGGESFLRVHWVAVPKALRARRVNKQRGLWVPPHRPTGAAPLARTRTRCGSRLRWRSECARRQRAAAGAAAAAAAVSRFFVGMARLVFACTGAALAQAPLRARRAGGGRRRRRRRRPRGVARTLRGGGQVSQNGYLLSRRGRSLPASASDVDTHRDSISSRFGCRSEREFVRAGYGSAAALAGARPPLDDAALEGLGVRRASSRRAMLSALRSQQARAAPPQGAAQDFFAAFEDGPPQPAAPAPAPAPESKQLLDMLDWA